MLCAVVDSLRPLCNFHLRAMNLKPIKTKKDYQQALERLEIIFDAKTGTKEGDELEILGILIDQYENELFPISLPDPIATIHNG
jgi:HTH-type transcriptional regulator / antitoxin HigA